MPLTRALPESLPAIPFVEESVRSPSLRQCAHGCPRVCAGLIFSYLLYGGLFVAVLLWTGVSCFGTDGHVHTMLPSFSRGSQIAEPLARPGETVISPEAAELAGKTIVRKSTVGELIDGKQRPDVKEQSHRAFIRLDEVRHIDIPKDYSYRLPVSEQVNRLMRR